MSPHHSPVSGGGSPSPIGGRVLVVAGSDSSASAGVQADLKTVSARGGYATTVITAVTAQSTQGVSAIHVVPAEVVGAQMTAVLDDLGADAVKTGMLCSPETITVVAETLERRATSLPLVVDPVMSSTSGSRLLSATGVERLRSALLPLARLVTPNVPEAEALTGLTVRDEDDMLRAAEALVSSGARAVLLKGGHLPGDRVVDLLVSPDAPALRFEAPRRAHTPRGTGCTLASAIATALARGEALDSAVTGAHAYLQRAIAAAIPRGGGPRVLDHDPPA